MSAYRPGWKAKWQIRSRKFNVLLQETAEAVLAPRLNVFRTLDQKRDDGLGSMSCEMTMFPEQSLCNSKRAHDCMNI